MRDVNTVKGFNQHRFCQMDKESSSLSMSQNNWKAFDVPSTLPLYVGCLFLFFLNLQTFAVGPLHRWSSFQVFWACAQCSVFEKNSNLCSYFFPVSSIVANLTQQQGKRRRSHDRVHSKRAHLVSFHFSPSMFFFFSPTRTFCELNAWQVDDVQSEQVVLEIAKFIGTGPRNISHLNISLVCFYFPTSILHYIWFTRLQRPLAPAFETFWCQFAWIVHKHRGKWHFDGCGSFGKQFAWFLFPRKNFGIAFGKQLYSQNVPVSNPSRI